VGLSLEGKRIRLSTGSFGRKSNEGGNVGFYIIVI